MRHSSEFPRQQVSSSEFRKERVARAEPQDGETHEVLDLRMLYEEQVRLREELKKLQEKDAAGGKRSEGDKKADE